MPPFGAQPMLMVTYSGTNKDTVPLMSTTTGSSFLPNRSILSAETLGDGDLTGERPGLHNHQKQIDVARSLQLIHQQGGILSVFSSLLDIYSSKQQTPLSGFFYDESSPKKDDKPASSTPGTLPSFGGLGSSYSGLSKSGFGFGAAQQPQQQPTNQSTDVPPYHDQQLWLEAKRCIPDYKRYTPVLVYGFEQLAARATAHSTTLVEVKKDIEALLQETEKMNENARKVKDLVTKSNKLVLSMESCLEAQSELPVPYEIACQNINQSLVSQYGNTLYSKFLLVKDALEKSGAEINTGFMDRFPVLKDKETIKQIREHLTTQGNVLMTISMKIKEAMKKTSR